MLRLLKAKKNKIGNTGSHPGKGTQSHSTNWQKKYGEHTDFNSEGMVSKRKVNQAEDSKPKL